MQRVQAAGSGKWGQAVLLIQLFGLVLAFIFGFLEVTALLGEDNIVFIVTDAAWPLSMVWMLVVGVSVIAAKRLPGCWRIVPVLCLLWLPISIIGDIAFGEVGNAIGIVFGAVLWALLGYIVRNSGERVGASPERPDAGRHPCARGRSRRRRSLTRSEKTSPDALESRA
jgi:hypothetical protein